MDSIKLAWLFPDLLNLHGERGNAKTFDIISKKMNVDLEIIRIDDLEEQIDFNEFDIVLINAGELKVIKTVIEKLNQNDGLKKYIEDNKVVFVTGTSGAIFADEIIRKDETFKGLNFLDMDVSERSTVIGDDLYYNFSEMEIMGCQIQMMDVKLNGATKMGDVIYGYGNMGDKTEGAIYKNLYFTNALGPVLVKNPWLCEYLIKLALKNKNIEYIDKEIDYDIEKKSQESIKELIDNKLNRK